MDEVSSEKERGLKNSNNEGKKRRSRDQRVPFYKLFSYADSLDVALMSVGTLAAIGNGLSMPLMTIIFGRIVNSFGVSNDSNVVHSVSEVCLEFVYLAIGSGVASFLLVSCWMVTGERQASRIRSLYLKTILRQDIAFFDKETTTGEIIGRMSGDTILIQDAMGEKVGRFIQMMANFIGGFAVAFFKGWQLAIVLMACIPAVIISGVFTSLFMSKMASRGQTAYSEAGHVVEQTVASIRTVVSFTGEKKAIMKYNDSIKNAYTCGVQQGLVSGIGVGCIMLAIFSIYGLGVWYGSKLIIEIGYSGGHVINVVMAVMNGGMSLAQASPSINAISIGSAAAYKMFETIDRKPEIDDYDKSGMVLEDINGDIELRDVHFRYPARPDVQVFSGFSLQMPRGTITALVGESGSGKSTVIGLIERFYDPEDGEVLIDGINLKKFQVGWIREKIGLVGQEPVLFMTSIRENIAYGKTNATLEEIRRATELANAAKFIDRLPVSHQIEMSCSAQGLDTMVSGTQLSGGQKQRLAIARAILKDPKILLLDEATSALDAESERIVQDALVVVMANRTTVAVAHRLSTVRNADNIAVVHRGKIVEQGPHSELIKDPEGPYSRLVSPQAGKGESEEAPKTDPGKVEPTFESNAALSISGSNKLLMGRSASKGSSGGGIGRHSFSLSFRLPAAISIHEGGQEGTEENETGHGHVEKPCEVSLTRLASLNKPELPVIILGTIGAAAHGVLFPVMGMLFSSAIKIFYEPAQQLRRDSRFWGLMFVCLGGISLVSVSVQQSMFGIAGAKLIERIRCLSFERVVHQEISWFDEPINSSGAIGARLSTDASTIRTLVGDALALAVQNIATIIAGILISTITNWQLALIILVLVPLLGLQGFANARFMKGFTADAKVMYEEASQVANEALSSIRTVASFCAEQKVIDLYEKKCEVPKKNGVRQGIVSGTGFGFSNLMLFCTYALCFYAGARFVQDGKATFPQVFRVFFALSMTALGVSQSSALAPDASKAKESCASIFAILDRKSKIDSSKDEGMSMPMVRGDIEFEHISFRYPTRPDVQIFEDLCLSIHSGKTVALVGESGSGKSTVIALLERFYDPDHGRILLDGIEIQKFELNWLRQQMGLVSQEPILFNDTIGANIAYCREGAVSEDEIIAAAKASNVHQFISGLPNGYNTNVGEKGVQLSGGQKQRIAIARAILKDPKILLLDEATSALDVESERVVQEALDNVMVNRTTVVVAHRLSTIKGADTIAVVKNQVIVEMGQHEALMKITDGAYASLVALHMSSST